MPGSRRPGTLRASSTLRKTAKGVTPKPCPDKNVFSLIRSCAMATLAARGVGLLRAKCRELLGYDGIVGGDHCGGEQSGVRGAGFADRKRRDRDALRHLDDRVE